MLYNESYKLIIGKGRCAIYLYKVRRTLERGEVEMNDYRAEYSAIQKYFSSLGAEAELIKEIEKIVVFKKYAAGEMLLKAGERTDYICLIIKGLVRGYYIDQNGNEITKCFSKEKDWCCSYSYLTEAKSSFYIETLEETTLARLDIAKAEDIMKSYPRMREMVEKLLYRTIIESEKRVLSFAGMEARERYLSLLNENPEIVKRAKQEQIASYLGITPSSLSRIKKSL